MNIKEKQNLRKRILTLLREQEEEDRLKKSLVIQKKLFKLIEAHKASTILFYASFDGEVCTFEMIKQARRLGKTLGLPVVNTITKEMIPCYFEESIEDLKEGYFGIKTPHYNEKNRMSLEKLDIVIVPGVAFDREKNRLGRGGGYYDRFLKNLPDSVLTVGVAFDFQIVQSLPLGDHDQPVKEVLTN